MESPRITVVGDERKGGTAALVERHASWLRARGCIATIVLDREESLAEIESDYVVVFGGDGSLLGAARRMGDNQRPTLGINCGRLGFLTAFEQEHTTQALQRMLAGDLHEDRRLMMRCSARTANGSTSRSIVFLNDVVVARRSIGGMITVRAWRGEIELASYRGDGLIVSTASGSTAYSMAVGGPVLSPGLGALVISPMASHTLSARSLVLPVADGLEIEVVETGGRKQATCQVDGQISLSLPVKGRAVLRPMASHFRHLVPGPTHFFDVLHRKFGFADMPRS